MTTHLTSNLIYNKGLTNPQKTALLLENKIVNYQSIEIAANKLAAHLQQENLKGQRIAFILPNGFEIITLYLACFKTGCIAMPINRRYAPPELERVIHDAEPRYLIIEAEKLPLLNKINLASTTIKKIVTVGAETPTFTPFNTLLADTSHFQTSSLMMDNPALIFYTSGSTGQPKGVIHTLSSIEAMLDSTSEALDEISALDKMIVCEPQCHVSGFIETFSVLSRGGTVFVHDGFDLNWYLATLTKQRPTLAVPHIDTIMKLLDSSRCTADAFSSLRGLYTGGDTLPEIVQKRFIACAGKPIQVGYGMTEAIWLTVCKTQAKKGCIGKPVNGVQLRLVNQDGEDVPPGETGEIWVKGAMVAKSYWNNTVETEKAFSKGWFKTGDTALLDDQGNYYFTGRIKNIIIRNTSNIMPGEIEAAIYQHQAVLAAAVVGIPDKKEGEVPIAFVVLKKGAALSEMELAEFLTIHIAAYKIPAKFYFIENMPLTPSGKIDHEALKHDWRVRS